MAQLALHEAMVVVLRRHGGGWVNRDDIAHEIATERLYLRPSDGRPPPTDQLRLRARKYLDLFECSDTACTQIRLKPVAPVGPAVAIKTQDPGSRAMEGTSEPDLVAAHTRRHESASRSKPERVRLLLVAEAPPKSLDRYFYFNHVRTQDSLFRHVVRSVLDVEATRAAKAELLVRLRDSGVFLIDLKTDPFDRRPLSDRVPDLVSRIRLLEPEFVMLIKVTAYDAAFALLAREQIPVVDERIPFPGSGQQKRFEAAMRQALARISWGQAG